MKLIRASLSDSRKLWEMQIAAFKELLEKYQDFDINPGSEPLEKVEMRLAQPFTYFYFITESEKNVGAIRVVDMKDGSRKAISPLFIVSEFRNKGFAQAAITAAEAIHGSDNWKLATILQEQGNCYLYEKMGYRKTGQTDIINDKMTIVYYEKN